MNRIVAVMNLFVLLLTITIKTTTSFIIHYHGSNINTKIRSQKKKEITTTRHYLSTSDNNRKKNEKSNKRDINQMDTNRRNVLQSISILSMPLLISSPSLANAYAQEEENGKVVLSTSTSNFPNKYSGTLSSSSSSTLELEEDELTEVEKKRISVFERVAPSVVYIDTFSEQRDAFSTNVMDVPLGAGSGFVWDEQGHIITNYHVIRTAKFAQVAILTRIFDNNIKETSSTTKGRRKNNAAVSNTDRLNSYTSSSSRVSYSTNSPDPLVTNYTRSVYKARVVGVDPSKDIAVLKIDAPVYDLYPIPLGTSNNLKVGQTAMAIGNPFGLDHTLTTGVLSGVGREVRSPIGRPISNVIQTDAAVNPGNSGGPLLNSSGKLIGMNTAIYSPTGTSAGIGFAIPVDTVRYIANTLIRDGKIIRPIIGISYLDSKQSFALGITKGVLVLDVPINSPAYKAGMKGTRRTTDGLIEIGDIIIKINDDFINTESDLFTSLEKYAPGDKVSIKVNRVDESELTTKGLKMKEAVLIVPLKSSSTELVNFKIDGSSSNSGSDMMRVPKDFNHN